jgi:hypothetical protein
MGYSREIIALAVWACAAAALAADPWLTPQPGLLLLKNGNILEGQITQAGDYYIVTLGQSGEVKLPAKDVDAQVATLEEAYELRRLGMFGRGAAPHLDLAEWCLRIGLHSRCGEQLVAALRIEPDNPRISDIERRLTQAATARPAAVARKPAAALVRTDEVERTIRSLPKSSIEKFAAVVQPLLLNRCGANQCHGGNSKSAFTMLRPPAGQVATQRFTQRNLYAVLEQIDKSNPEASPLIVLPQQQHGTSFVPVFDKHTQKQLAELMAWVRMTAADPQASSPATIPTGEPATLSQPSGSAAREQTISGAASVPVAETSAAIQPSAEGAAAQRKTPASDRFVPRDPFDPDIFNRRFSGLK